MKIIELIRLIRKHLVLLITVSVLAALLVTMLTRNPKLTFASKTTLYTGLATGSTVEMDKTYNYALTNTSFDNLINIIKSRETQQNVAIRLLSQHLLLPGPDPKYISKQSWEELKRITPEYIYNYVVKSKPTNTITTDTIPVKTKNKGDSLRTRSANTHSADSSQILYKSGLFPASVSRLDFEKTVYNLTQLMHSSDTNFVYKLLNYTDPHYSIAAISGVKAERIASSDLVRLSYETDDPGICQQTLAIYSEVSINNFKNIKENRSDAVVKYFESQLKQADDKLKEAEDDLLAFNKSNNIINYYEQSKAVAVVKEDMEVDYNNKKAQLAGIEAATRRLEDKLNIQQVVQLKSGVVMDKKKRLSEVNYLIAEAEADNKADGPLKALRNEANVLKEEIRKNVGDLYAYQNTTDGLPVSKVLNEWINSVVEADNLRASIRVMDQRNRDFQQQYSIYAPAGAHIKRIEREIAVSEQGYLEILHGLNLAKLKLQDNELSSNLKAVDLPFYPLTPTPTKRKVLIIAGALVSAMLVLGLILVLEYFDETLKNLKRAAKTLQLPALGIIPKVYLHPETSNFPYIQNRLLEFSIQNMEQFFGLNNGSKITKTILFVSTQENEGKTTLAGNLALKLTRQGKKVIVLNYNHQPKNTSKHSKFPIFSRLLGYSDPRIDYNSPFLAAPENYLPKENCFTYTVNDDFYNSRSYTEILEHNGQQAAFVPDYVLIELPALLSKNYPTELMSMSDLVVLVCRANRIWTESDQLVINSIQPLTGNKLHFIINGSQLKEVEAVIGDLPKKRSILRKKLKNLFRFQFFSSNRI
ncbi:MAG TPA: hypothetical protein PLB49_08320 [Chitinophagaceae bacterium]|nr:hypothetical protein [Chitinophagaceae bacterium]